VECPYWPTRLFGRGYTEEQESGDGLPVGDCVLRYVKRPPVSESISAEYAGDDAKRRGPPNPSPYPEKVVVGTPVMLRKVKDLWQRA